MSWRVRFSPVVSSINIYLNPKDPNCFGVRSFLRNNLPELRVLNPETTFNIQELSFGEPTMYVSYNFVDQRLIRLAGATEDEAEDIFSAVSQYGNTHALPDSGVDDHTFAKAQRIVNFGFAESTHAMIDGPPTLDNGQHGTNAVDDPGQQGRVLPRNENYKIIP